MSMEQEILDSIEREGRIAFELGNKTNPYGEDSLKGFIAWQQGYNTAEINKKRIV